MIESEDMFSDTESLESRGISMAETRFRNIPLLSLAREPSEYHEASISIGGTPGQTACFDGSHIWLTDGSNGYVYKVDISTGTIVGTITGLTQANHMVYGGGYVWCFAGGGTTIFRVDPITLVSTQVSGSYSGLEVGSWDGSLMWLPEGNYNATMILWSINPKTLATTQYTTSVYSNGYTVHAILGYTNLWCTSDNGNLVAPYDPATNIWGASVGVGSTPLYGASDGTNIWVANYNSGTLSKVAFPSGTVVATVTTGGNPQMPAFDGRYMWVGLAGSANQISQIDIETNSVINTFTTAGTVNNITFDGTHIWYNDTTNNAMKSLLVRRD